MGETADVVVVGAGLFGTSVAYQLARRGAGSVTLVERRAVGGGDSGLSFGMVRRHYSNEVTARLAMRGAQVIENWSDEVGTGDSGYVRTGYLLTVDSDRKAALAENVARLRTWGFDTVVVSPEEITEIEPLLSVDGIAGAAYEADGGFADAEKMTLAWFAAALRERARGLIGRRVVAVRVEGGRVRGVDTDQGPIDAGSWSMRRERGVGRSR